LPSRLIHLVEEQLSHSDDVGHEVLLVRVRPVDVVDVIALATAFADEGPAVHLELGQGGGWQGQRQVEQLAHA